jgi:hypothetical protein
LECSLRHEEILCISSSSVVPRLDLGLCNEHVTVGPMPILSRLYLSIPGQLTLFLWP